MASQRREYETREAEIKAQDFCPNWSSLQKVDSSVRLTALGHSCRAKWGGEGSAGDGERIRRGVRDEKAEARGSPYSWDLSYPLQSNYC